MIIALLRYYWQVLKYGKPQPRKEIDPVYGRKELQKNQIWYGMTALAIVGGLAIYMPLAVLNFYVGEKGKNSGNICKMTIIPLCNLEPLPPPPPPYEPISCGTQVDLIPFKIPRPVVKPKVYHCTFVIPEPDPAIHNPESEILEEKEIEELLKSIKPFEDISEEDSFLGESGIFEGFYDDPIPLNLDEIKDDIGYPQIAKDAGILGTVIMRIKLDKEGKYISHKLINQVHPILVNAVEQHLPNILFSPIYQQEEAIPFSVNVPFYFE